jgi:hypothetical protein
VPKQNFTEAKEVAVRYLNACPTDVIQHLSTVRGDS